MRQYVPVTSPRWMGSQYYAVDVAGRGLPFVHYHELAQAATLRWSIKIDIERDGFVYVALCPEKRA